MDAQECRLERLYAARTKVAKLVKQDISYMPYFKRIADDIKAAEQEQDLLSQVLKYAA